MRSEGRYGYARTFTKKQHIKVQKKRLVKAGCVEVIEDEFLSDEYSRGWDKVEKLIKKAYITELYITDIGRLGCCANEALDRWLYMFSHAIELTVLDDPAFDTKVFTGEVLSASQSLFLEVYIRLQLEAKYMELDRKQKLLSAAIVSGIWHSKQNGKANGRRYGAKIETSKYRTDKKIIKKHYRKFGGRLSSSECLRLCNISRNTFFKYVKRILKEEGA